MRANCNEERMWSILMGFASGRLVNKSSSRHPGKAKVCVVKEEMERF